jgi:hypothetical protein
MPCISYPNSGTSRRTRFAAVLCAHAGCSVCSAGPRAPVGARRPRPRRRPPLTWRRLRTWRGRLRSAERAASVSRRARRVARLLAYWSSVRVHVRLLREDVHTRAADAQRVTSSYLTSLYIVIIRKRRAQPPDQRPGSCPSAATREGPRRGPDEPRASSLERAGAAARPRHHAALEAPATALARHATRATAAPPPGPVPRGPVWDRPHAPWRVARGWCSV